MCLAVPMKLIARTGDTGTAELDGVRVGVALTLCPGANIGDWLIVHAGYALTVMDEQAAAETHGLIRLARGEAP